MLKRVKALSNRPRRHVDWWTQVSCRQIRNAFDQAGRWPAADIRWRRDWKSPRLVLQPMQRALEEGLGGRAISPILHQNGEDDPVLVYRAPQIVQHAADADEHLIEMPGIARLRRLRQPRRRISCA